MARLRHISNLNADTRIKAPQEALNRAMLSTSLTERKRIPNIQEDLAKAYNDEKTYWKQKSQNKWMVEGDRNTNYFHSCTKVRFAKTD